MNVSSAGLAAIRQYEALRLHAYQDSGGVWTIGYGTTHYEDGSPVAQGDQIDPARAEALLAHHVGQVDGALAALVRVPLSQSQYDALASLAYNIGTGAFSSSTLLRKLNAGDAAGAADEFLRWDHVGHAVVAGLERRREAERAMFLSTDTQAAGAAVPPSADATAAAPPAPIPPLTAETIIMAGEGDTTAAAAAPAPAAPDLGATVASVATAAAPLLSLINPLAGALAAVIPKIAPILLDKTNTVPQRNMALAGAVLDTVAQATGAATHAQAVQRVIDDADARAQAEAALAPFLVSQEAGSGGIGSARDFALRTMDGKFWLMPAFWITLSLLPLLYGVVLVVLTSGGSMFSGELRAAIASSVVTGILGSVLGFWLGSSLGSQRKDQTAQAAR